MTPDYGAIISLVAFILLVGSAMLLYGGVGLVKAVQSAKPGDRAPGQK